MAPWGNKKQPPKNSSAWNAVAGIETSLVIVDLTSLGATESMPIKHFCTANVDQAGLLIKIRDRTPLGKFFSHCPGFRQYFEHNMRLDV